MELPGGPLREPPSVAGTAPPGLWTTDFRPCAHCSVSIQGWTTDRRLFFFFFLEKNETWMAIGAASAGGRCLPGLQASLCPPSTGTEHARSLGRAAVEACFRAYKNACPGLVWISTESFAECSSCQDSTFQKAMQEGSGVGRYSLTDCALLARLKKQPRSAAVHQPRRRNGPHEPSTAHLPHPSWPRW